MSNFDSPIFITGVPRSGTSLIAGIINLCGAWGGKMIGGNKNNQKGFFENIEIRSTILKSYLTKIGADPMGQDPLPHLATLSPEPGLRQKAVEIIQKQGYKDGLWFYKDAKLLLTWPIWHEAFPDAKWILVCRESDEIAWSCMRTGFMRAKETHKDWLDWVDLYKSYITKPLGNPFCGTVNNYIIWPKEILLGHWKPLEAMLEFLELKLNRETIKKFIDPSLYYIKDNVQKVNI